MKLAAFPDCAPMRSRDLRREQARQATISTMSCSRADHHGATGTLLARSHARSDDAEADSFEQPLVAPAIHPFTGTFAASEHTVAFGSKAFRLMFPLHVFALVLMLFSVLRSCDVGHGGHFFLPPPCSRPTWRPNRHGCTAGTARPGPNGSVRLLGR